MGLLYDELGLVVCVFSFFFFFSFFIDNCKIDSQILPRRSSHTHT